MFNSCGPQLKLNSNLIMFAVPLICCRALCQGKRIKEKRIKQLHLWFLLDLFPLFCIFVLNFFHRKQLRRSSINTLLNFSKGSFAKQLFHFINIFKSHVHNELSFQWNVYSLCELPLQVGTWRNKMLEECAVYEVYFSVPTHEYIKMISPLSSVKKFVVWLIDKTFKSIKSNVC